MSGDSAFFEELQSDFLNESSFMFEQYEESMMKLENSEEPAKDLTDIFRVAHSVKGGAAAVGLLDLAKFAHVMEDLLDLLRSQPSLVNANVISLLLTSGDELKNRISALQRNENGPWDTSALVAELIALTESLSGQEKSHGHGVEPVKPAPTSDDFFSMSFDPAAEIATEFSKEYQKDYKVTDPTELVEDFTNYELLAELLSQMPQEEQIKYEQSEQPKVAPVVSTTVDLPMPKLEESPVPLFMTDGSLEDLFAQSAKPNPPVIAPHVASAEPSPESPPVVAVVTASKPAPTPVAPLKVVAKEKGDSSNSDGHGKPSGKAPLKGAHSVIKVDTGRVDSVLDAVGELVVLKNQLVHDETVHNGSNLRLEAIVDQLDKAVRELYEKTLSIRMTPLKSMFVKIQRIVRDLSITLEKPVDLNLIGEETEVERTVFELLGDPLVHLVRNSMDHGIENKTLRQQRGKSAVSKVTVSAKQSGGNVIIEIIDDGGGINRERVLGKAIERGLVPHGVDPASLADESVFQFIFQPGFSTADKISDLSGRGVGLDVVKSNLDKINGKINIQSKAGLGTTFRLTIPLTTAITDGIIVALDGARYILPIHSIREIVRVVPKDYTNVSNAGKVANIRGHLLPVIDVSTTLGTINWALNLEGQTSDKRRDGSLSERREETMLVIIESMVGQMAFPVDDVLGQAQVVVKPISTGHYIPEVSGAAILGDGRTVLILDPSALINHVMKVSEMSA